MSRKTIVTIGKLGTGERIVELEPGETFQETFDDPGYISVVAGEPGEEDDRDPGEKRFVVGISTEKQKETNDDRVVESDRIKCPSCGNRYPKMYSRCDGCGEPNQND